MVAATVNRRATRSKAFARNRRKALPPVPRSDGSSTLPPMQPKCGLRQWQKFAAAGLVPCLPVNILLEQPSF